MNGWTWKHHDLDQIMPKIFADIGVIRRVKHDAPLGLVPKSRVYKNPISPNFSQCLNYLTSRAMLGY